MNVLAVDDEKMALGVLESSLHKVLQDAEIHAFRYCDDALKFAKTTICEIAFLDINLREMNGITLAKKLKIQNPKINIIFITGYSDYATEAFALHASGYIMKPVSPDKIAAELKELRFPIIRNDEKRVRFQAFGNFEVYVDGGPVYYQYAKTKEMLAYIVDRRGALCTNKEIMAILWEDKDRNSYYQNLRMDLFNNMPQDIFVMQWGKIGIIPEMVECDYFDWIQGKPDAINKYNGEYMAQYSWAETTINVLDTI